MARELAVMLNARGLAVDKSTVNRALYNSGKPAIHYDAQTYTYTVVTSQAITPQSAAPANFVASPLSQSPAIVAIKRTPDVLPGMLVRIPIDEPDAETLAFCRDFRIGHLVRIDDDQHIISLYPSEHDPFQKQRVTVAAHLVRRCHALTPAPFYHRPTETTGTLLIPQSGAFEPGTFIHYFARLNGRIKSVSEADIQIQAHTQMPDPAQQLRTYEFHPPVWKDKRDDLLDAVLGIANAAFGLDEVIASRLLLLPHQAETIARALSDRQVRYVLGDEVGLGKTIEACVILRGLRRRQPDLRTLIIAPHTLVRQWQSELNNKFWMRLEIVSEDDKFGFDPTGAGIILRSEDLERFPRLTASLLKREWGLLIVDEAHRLYRRPAQYEAVFRLSADIEHCLLLSATPILRYAAEYHALLQLMSPQQYGALKLKQFEAMLRIQSDLRGRLAYTARALNDTDFDAHEFLDEIIPVTERLEDAVLPSLITAIDASAPDRGLAAAVETHSYISENYRIENRVIRNRRASLEGLIPVPTRALDDSYSYQPTPDEREVLADLTDYARAMLRHNPDANAQVRMFMTAAASSPFTLRTLLLFRQAAIGIGRPDDDLSLELRHAISEQSAFPDESEALESLLTHLEIWCTETQRALDITGIPAPDAAHRLQQVLRAVRTVTQRGQKVLVFYQWHQTGILLQELISKRYSVRQYAVFATTRSLEYLQNEIDRFQSNDECRIMLSDEAGGEGRNFQIADVVIHVDLPWTPARIEQRIGRLDRLGRAGTVTSVVPYARGTLEADLFRLWHGAFEIFTRSMSGMEIVLEQIQDRIDSAFTANPSDGLALLYDEMVNEAAGLRAIVEEERYAEESAAQLDRRKLLSDTLDRYRDGEKLRHPLLRWAGMAGLEYRTEYDPTSRAQLTVFDPKMTNMAALKNAKFVTPPDMQEALRYARRKNTQVLRGTFDRDLAVKREDIIFFAPGEPWTDALITNALLADRAMCAAIGRDVPGLEDDWHGFEFLFSVRLDARPLLAAGDDPVHLFRAQGYLMVEPTFRVLIGHDGKVMNTTSRIARAIDAGGHLQGDEHLGKRSGLQPALISFMEQFPPGVWQVHVNQALERAWAYVRHEFSFTEDLGQEARAAFDQRIAGQRAAHRWLHGKADSALIDEEARIALLLVEGIAQPLIRLESACAWWLRATESQITR